MTNVTPFTPKVTEPEEPPISDICLICAPCGCKTFMHYDDGHIECANCYVVIRTIKDDDNPDVLTKWRREVADPEPDVPEEEPYIVGVRHFGSAELAKARVLKKINGWGDDLIAVFGYNVDGEGSHWSGTGTAEERDKLVEKMEKTIQFLKETGYRTD